MRLLLAALALLAFPPSAAAWEWPVRGEVITQFRNGADPYAGGQHRGIDVAAPAGAPVLAATAGTIDHAGVVGASGLTISQRTADGRHRLSYLHLARVAVRRGQTVAAGERLGDVGVSGERSAQPPHLHFGVRDAAERHGYLDPLRFLPPPPPEPQPRPVTAPLTASEPARPEPAPSGAPVTAPAPSAVPALEPAVPVAVAGVAAAPRPVKAPTPATGTAAQAPARPAPVAAGAPERAPAAPAAGPVAVERRASRAAAPRSSAAAPEGGVDAGWLGACVGLVAAAGLLAGPHGARRGHAPVRTAFGALLRAASRG